MSGNENTLTNYLLSQQIPTPYSSAIAHPFLNAAASLTLPSSRLALWLFQDCIYAAQAYPRFIAQLITKIPLDDGGLLASRTLKVLVGCLDNIVREVSFFDDTATKYGLPLEGWMERKATRDYTAEMARMGAFASLEDGLVFLWGMEKVYLDAWSGVYNSLSQLKSTDSDSNVAQAIKDLSYSWSSENRAFAEFVQNIGDLVDDYFSPAMNGKAVAGHHVADALARARAIWARVVELEAEFWPNEGEEGSLAIKRPVV